MILFVQTFIGLIYLFEQAEGQFWLWPNLLLTLCWSFLLSLRQINLMLSRSPLLLILLELWYLIRRRETLWLSKNLLTGWRWIRLSRDWTSPISLLALTWRFRTVLVAQIFSIHEIHGVLNHELLCIRNLLLFTLVCIVSQSSIVLEAYLTHRVTVKQLQSEVAALSLSSSSGSSRFCG